MAHGFHRLRFPLLPSHSPYQFSGSVLRAAAHASLRAPRHVPQRSAETHCCILRKTWEQVYRKMCKSTINVSLPISTLLRLALFPFPFFSSPSRKKSQTKRSSNPRIAQPQSITTPIRRASREAETPTQPLTLATHSRLYQKSDRVPSTLPRVLVVERRNRTTLPLIL